MTGPQVADAIARALASTDPALGVREETAADFAFVCDLYAEVRHDELLPVPWSEQAKRDFLDSQCRLQWDHYTTHYVGAERLLILASGAPVGRLYVHAKPKEFRLMDIALVAARRGRGIGTLIVRTLLDIAHRSGADVTLHVEPTNPARRIYERLGFDLIEHRGVYDFLGFASATHAASDS